MIFITANTEVQTAVAAMKTGAIEFLEKPFDRDMLVELIEKAFELDKQWRCRDQEFKRLEDQVDKLTDRERQTLDLIIAGKPNKTIASRLQISERAVEMRRSRIMDKLGVRSIGELLDVAITHPAPFGAVRRAPGNLAYAFCARCVRPKATSLARRSQLPMSVSSSWFPGYLTASR